MEVVLYAKEGCPNCEQLKMMLSNVHIKYSTVIDTKQIIKMGFMSAPVLVVDGNAMAYAQAKEWVSNHQQKENV